MAGHSLNLRSRSAVSEDEDRTPVASRQGTPSDNGYQSREDDEEDLRDTEMDCRAATPRRRLSTPPERRSASPVRRTSDQL